MSVGNLHMMISNFSVGVRYSLLSSTALVTEGLGFTLTLNANGIEVANGTTIAYTIDSIASSDITTSLTGQFSLTDNSAQVPITSTENDDTILFVLGDTGLGAKTVKKYSTDRKLSSAVLQETYNEIEGSANLGMFFKPDSSKMWLQDATNDEFREYSLTSAPDIDQWKLSTLDSTVVTGSYGTTGGNHQGMWMDETGTILYQIDRDIKTILQDGISAWDPIGPGTPSRSLDISSDTSLPSGITVSRDGTRAFVSSLSPTVILEYSGVANQCNNWALTHTLTLGYNASDVFVDTKVGTKMYVSDNDGKVHMYKLATPWDLGTATFMTTLDLTGTFTNIYSVYVVEPDSEVFRMTLDAADSVGNKTYSASETVTIENTALLEEVFYGELFSYYPLEAETTLKIPVGVTEISALVVGSGGGGASGVNKGTANNANNGGGGGGGGALAYGTFSVTPGEILDITIGIGGAGGVAAGAGAAKGRSGTSGEPSYIRRSGTILLGAAGGGGGGVHGVIGPNGAGGTFSNGTARTAGGLGGQGGGWVTQETGPIDGAAGGGAGGYSGNGGQGHGYNTTATAGTGGAGAGGHTDNDLGGGVGVTASGTSGTPGHSTKNGSVGPVFAGGGGGGGDGWNSSTVPYSVYGNGGNNGSSGAVRIIWGNINNTREYPSTNTENFLI